MQLFSSDDTGTRIGEAIGTVLAAVVYFGFIALLANMVLHFI